MSINDDPQGGISKDLLDMLGKNDPTITATEQVAFVMRDGGLMCFKCVNDNIVLINGAWATRNHPELWANEDAQWDLTGAQVACDDDVCAHCSGPVLKYPEPPCGCNRYPNMHDNAGVCTQWERHGALPCNEYHDEIDLSHAQAIERMSARASR